MIIDQEGNGLDNTVPGFAVHDSGASQSLDFLVHQNALTV